MIVYDDLQPGHFAEWGMTFSGDPSRLLGFACRKDGDLIAIGLVWVDADDRWVAGFRGRPGFPAGIHRKAVELLGALDAAGVAEVWAEADTTIPRARAWLERLGFERADPVKEVYKRGIHSSAHRRH